MLVIRNLHVKAGDKAILRGLDLEVKAGEVHALMGPNGSGKSTLAHVLAGRAPYEVTEGEVRFEGRDLLGMSPEERAWAGVFLAFQYPVELPGVGSMYFMRTALNAIRKARGEEPLDAIDFLATAREKMKLLQIDKALLERAVNQGFSGGEKKRNEILQMAILEPEIAVLDETDSGLDIDALKVVANGVGEVRKDRPDLGVLAITHYQRLLDHLQPDVIHILMDGRIVQTGGLELAEVLEREGYEAFRGEPAGATR